MRSAVLRRIVCGLFLCFPVSALANGLLAEYWYNVSGSSIGDLTSQPNYPHSPAQQSYIRRFEISPNAADNYGTRVRGYLLAPSDGEYTFWVAADDAAQLWLSTDALADNAILIASVPSATNLLEWDRYPEQQSVTITLSAGHKYYIELLHKEGISHDHFAVAWQGPQISRQVIGISYLLPWIDELRGDFTGNGIVNTADLTSLLSIWLDQSCDIEPSMDVNGNCGIDIVDFCPLAQNWLADLGQWDDTTLQIQENEFGYAGVVTGTIDSDNAGFTGQGFVNSANTSGAYIEWHAAAAESGTYLLKWRFANIGPAARTASVSVNGIVQAASVSFPSTGAWNTWNVTSAVPVVLAEGTNTIRLTAENAEGLANIDWIEVTGKLARKTVVDYMRIANDYFMAKWPDPGVPIVTDKTRPSNIWTRATYYEGLMALYEIDPQPRYYNYAVEWGTHHNWNLRYGNTDVNADDQCCGQTYIDLYWMDPKPERLVNIKNSVDIMLSSSSYNDDWSWIDALHMAMPVFAKLGAVYDNDAYFEKMYAMYNHTKVTRGLYNSADRLWWRDTAFDPPYVEPNGEDCYWSRGNGWVFAAMVRVVDVMPADAPHRQEYVQMFTDMAAALAAVQRADGFWNVSLHDPTHYGGKELSGTAMFAYGMAWGVNNGLLDHDTYAPVALRAWNGMVQYSLHSNGFLGYVQSTASKPADGQPLSYDKVPNFEDYALGAFLLAGREIHELLQNN